MSRSNDCRNDALIDRETLQGASNTIPSNR